MISRVENVLLIQSTIVDWKCFQSSSFAGSSAELPRDNRPPAGGDEQPGEVREGHAAAETDKVPLEVTFGYSRFWTRNLSFVSLPKRSHLNGLHSHHLHIPFTTSAFAVATKL